MVRKEPLSSQPATSADSYKSYYEEGYKEDHALRYDGGGGPCVLDERYTELRRDTLSWLRQLGLDGRPDARILELGCGLAQLSGVHPGWEGLEYSETAVSRVKEALADVKISAGDMQNTPYPDASFDAIFSWAAIEHVPSPERVLREVERLLVRGGVAILGPAWNCRSWTVKRLPLRKYRDLNAREKVEKATIPIREHLLWRAAASIPGRLTRELRAMKSSKPVEFDYAPLRPDFSLDLPHVSDDDAQSSMDPHAAIMYFSSRRWEIVRDRHKTSR